MKIALFCSSRNIIPSLKTGGTEQPIFYLARELARRGHQITLYAARGSKVPGVKIKEISPFATCVRQKHLNIQERISSFYDLTALSNFFKKDAKDFDLVQFNSYLFYEILPFVKFSKTPVIIRINYPHYLMYPYIKDYLKEYKNVYYLPISHFIKSVMPDLKYLEPIYPCVDLKDFKFCSRPDDYLLFVGRVCSRKGAHLAIEIANMAEKKLIIAGRIDEQPPQEYFNNYIKPFIDNKKIIYLGEVDYKEKIKLYQKAKATLFPIQEDESFGNVQIESMACGTPVIAFDRAACREAIAHGQSGLIVENGSVSQMIEAVENVDKLNRREVREWVENNFSVKKIVDRFEKLYQSILR